MRPFENSVKLKLCSKVCFFTILVGVFVLSFLRDSSHSFKNHNPFSNSEDISNDLDFLGVFENLDTDGNGVLIFDEFSALKQRYKLLPVDISALKVQIQGFPDLPIKAGDQIVNIKTLFQPLNLSSLSKDLQSISQENLGSWKGLFKWKKPFKHGHNFSAQSFGVFLPSKQLLVPGMTWNIVEAEADHQVLPSSSKKHFPPLVDVRLRPLFALLSLFHPHVFLLTRFAPQGTKAILRAVGEDFLDIVFRVHAEFQLNKPPSMPFWFTPAQFSGRLIINRRGTLVHHFQMEVPAQRKLNVDMEWLNGPSEEENMEVDIGYIPEMKLSSNPTKDASFVLNSLCHTDECRSTLQEISMAEALHAIDEEFYPFTKVKYYNFSDAFQIAAAESKLVHGILLWGALDDQSC